jgi:hypothetical protein
MAKTKKDDIDEEEPKEDLSGDGTIAVNDAWTGMLAISLLALGVATGLLAWDYFKYEDAPPAKSSLIGSAPKAPAAEKKADGGPAPAAKDKDKDKDKDKG